MKAQTRAYLEKAKDNIAASVDLIQSGHIEIAASRTYYAMFYTVEALLTEEGEEFSSHAAVQGAFGQRFTKTGRLDAKFHRYLIDAYRERQAADYDAPAEVGREEAEILINQAREFLAAAEELLNQSSR